MSKELEKEVESQYKALLRAVQELSSINQITAPEKGYKGAPLFTFLMGHASNTLEDVTFTRRMFDEYTPEVAKKLAVEELVKRAEYFHNLCYRINELVHEYTKKALLSVRAILETEYSERDSTKRSNEVLNKLPHPVDQMTFSMLPVRASFEAKTKEEVVKKMEAYIQEEKEKYEKEKVEVEK